VAQVAAASRAAERQGHQSSYRPADHTFVCRQCQGVSKFVQIARGERARLLKVAESHEVSQEESDEAERVIRDLEAAGLGEAPRSLRQAKQAMSIIGRAKAKVFPPPPLDLTRAHAGRRAAGVRRRELSGRGEAAPASPADERRGDRIVAAKWRRGTTYGVSLCPVCETIYLCREIGGHGSRSGRRTTMHGPCLVEAMKTSEAKAWLSRRKLAQLAGRPKSWIDIHLQADIPFEGRLPSTPKNLPRDFTWAVRNLLGDEPAKDLAAEAGVTQQAVSAAIAGVLVKLPPMERVSRAQSSVIGRLTRAREDRARRSTVTESAEPAA
jgi:hypothetical protein